MIRGNALPGVCAFLTLLVLILISSAVSYAQTANEAKGLPNFGQVSNMLYRGAQPSITGFNALKAMGVAIVVNFRDESDEIASEKNAVESLGMKYISIPWNGSDNPSSVKVSQFLDLIRGNQQTKIFVHCKAGADRTGTMIAAYRIADEHKSAADAITEMHQYHYHHFWLPQLERWVATFPNLLTADEHFKSINQTVSAPAEPALVPAGMVSSAMLSGAASLSPMTSLGQ